MRPLFFIVLLSLYGSLNVSLAGTDSTAAIQTTIGASEVLRWSSALLFVLMLFFLCVWMLRKTTGMYSVTAQQMRVIGGLSLGAKERVVLLQVGSKQLLLGVTPARIDTLHILEGDECLLIQDKDLNQQASNHFAAKLMQVMQANHRG